MAQMAAAKGFGDFFRSKRKALGFTLRDFCRRNALDPGNVSRMERGIVPPSTSSVVLETYAKALKLPPDSDDWHSLFELAALASGSIPTHLAASQVVRESLSGIFRSLRKSPRRSASSVSAREMQNWADYRDARGQFPRLIRRLIHATSKSVERIEFAAGEGNERRGWDGIVNATAATAYVPAGLSVWELGVGRDPASKVNEDLRRRTKNPLGVEPAQATYIAVSARRWEGKNAWESKTNNLGTWKEVRVYDADTLEAWLELAPGVDVWFARLVGKQTEGMVDPDEYWGNLAALREPHLTPSLFLASREAEIKALEEWLTGPPSSLAVEARSPAEVIDFFAACLAKLDDATRDGFASRVVIVETKQAWSLLVEEAEGMTLIAKAGLALDAENVAAAVRKGHRVLLCSDRFGTGESRKLIRPYVYDLQKALVESGFSEDDAWRRARDCGGSLTALKRRISQLPATTDPEWSRGNAASDLAPLLLAGSWGDSCAADQSFIARVGARSYAEMSEIITRWSLVPDPPLIRLSARWSLTSREDSWILLARYLRADHFERWEPSAIEVLVQDDPTLDLPAEKRAWASAQERATPYSEALRNGIAETLALLASRPVDLGSHGENEAARAERIVGSVLGGAPGWKRWASLGPQLPLLAEAAPDTFLSAVEAELREANPEIMRLFESSGERLFSRCMHAGLLWALETLAWDRSRLSPASIILARLAELDSRGQRSNRPDDSLTAIFLPWLPQTAADVEVRMKVIRAVTDKCPDTGWRMLLGLLPAPHQTSRFTHRPVWRDWTTDWRRDVTNSDYWKQVEFCGQRILAMIGSDTARWVDVIEHIADLPPASRKDAASRLANTDVAMLSVDDRQKVAEALRKQIRLHRDYRDADWAIAGDELPGLEQALEHIEPEDPVPRNAWLFALWTELPELRGGDSPLEKLEEEVGRRRRQALADVFNDEGMKSILKLVEVVEFPWCVGFELAKCTLARDDVEILPDLLAGTSRRVIEFARGYALARFQMKGWEWLTGLSLDDWSGEQVASLALALPAERETWRLFERNGEHAIANYWSQVQYPQLYSGIRNAGSDDVRHALTMLLRQRRPFTAACLLSVLLNGNTKVDAALVVETLDSALEPNSELAPNNVGHCIQNLIQYLQAPEAGVDEATLARLEWAFLGLLRGHPVTPSTLHRTLASDPALFAELMKLVFRSSNEPETAAKDPTDETQRRAESAFELLHSWKMVPGLDKARNTVNETELRSWTVKARELCRESGRLEVCDIQIGELLANAPSHADGSWPCIPVRDLIEDTGSENLVDGFVIGCLNKRDVYWKSPIEGGDQERVLQNEYVGYARACDAEWPATADALRRVARDYEEDARREDAAAEARRLGR